MMSSSENSHASDTKRDALARLTPLGRNGTLALILGGLALSFWLAGYFVIYWRNADMDFMIVYNALALNDGKPQAFFDHPSFFTILTVKWWFQLMHALGLQDAWKLSAIPSAMNVPAFDAAMTEAIRAGRVVAWLTGTVLVAIFAVLMRYVVRDWRVAMLATSAFAFSGGVAVHLRILRSEMIAGSLFAFALLILIAVGRNASAWRPLAVAGAAALCVLGMENKIQIVLLIAALPLMILPFGTPSSASASFWRNSTPAWIAAGVAAVIAMLAFTFALPIIRDGLDPANTSAWFLKPLLMGTFGVYQIALLAWIGIGMVVYASIWRVSVAETLAAMCAVIAGASLGLLALYLQYNPANAVAVVNPIEKMLVFTGTDPRSDAGAQFLQNLGVLFVYVKNLLARYSFVLFTSPRPTVFLLWLIVPGIIVALRRGERQVALQATLLIMVTAGIDTLGIQRGLKPEYFILTDPLIILAGALLLDRLEDLRWSRWTYIVGMVLIVVHIGISQAEPVKHVFKRSGPEYICEWNQDYQPELPLPWCDLPKKRP